MTRRATIEQRAELCELDIREKELHRQSAALRTADEFQSDEAECIHLELDDIAAKRKTIRDTLASWSSEAKASAGAIVTVGREGDPEIIRGLVREADRKAAKAAAEGVRADRSRPGALAEPGEPASEGRSTSSESKGAGPSDALVRRLMAHRTVALQVLLAQNTQVALAALVDSMLPSSIDEHCARGQVSLQITARPAKHRLLGAADDVEQSRAWAALAARQEGWRERVPNDPGERFEWLISLPQAELLDLLALCVALSLDAVTGRDEARRADDVAKAVGLPPRQNGCRPFRSCICGSGSQIVVGGGGACGRRSARWSTQRVVHGKPAGARSASSTNPRPDTAPSSAVFPEPVLSTSRGRREHALARYGQAFKDRAVARLLPPESAALDDVSRDVGIGVNTLVRWRSDSMSKPGRDRVWTAAARFDAVLTTAAMDEASKSAWCRAHGTYVQQLATWQLNATQALAEPGEARASPLQTKQVHRRIKELERELLRKDRALAETAALLVLSKKAKAIFNTGEAE